MTDMLSQLAAADTTYANVQPQEGFSLHPQFKGIAEVTEARIEERKNSEGLQLFVRLKTELGTTATWVTVSHFASEKAVAYAKKQLLCLGHQGSFSDLLKGGIEKMIGRSVEVQVKHRKWEGTDQEDVYLNRAVESSFSNTAQSDFVNQFNSAENFDDLPFE